MDKGKWAEYGEKRLLSRNRLLLPHHRLITKYLLDFFKNFDVTFRVLDIGCGDGYFMELLRNLGFENISGVDLSSSMINKALKKGLHVELKDIYELNEENKFDVVLLMDVLEHLENPGEALRKIYKILAPGGIVYLNIPICDSLALRCWRAITFKSRKELVCGWDETHINAFSKKELLAMLRKQGFITLKSQRLANRFPFINRISSDFSDFLQQFTIFGVFGDLFTVIARKQ
jgi:2-polyprenyl-3-methyl-5-hydroxy-6-metoxy-1,4-benzoquinol methylase